MGSPTEVVSELEEPLASAGAGASKERLDALIDLAYALRATEQWDRMHALATEASTLAHELQTLPPRDWRWERSLSSNTSVLI